ncbi:hypothetical protein PCC8801_2176 [Rippkaea orientalis PCC 8801]|uniref:Uncharacterized protein n=1 Tax=Rippkaea orientalis (strain PCC 8801 / RF-1) TaxID=41431 RepID=B7K057_RIPO1|nr:hypothetical protein [Rippkaea orientalis]ACK66204.1 hypothetical protein PCC8801_2176 [Rippkaea orientalis PCC 8801]
MKTIIAIVIICATSIITPLIPVPTAIGEIPVSLRKKSNPVKIKPFGARYTIYGNLQTSLSQSSKSLTVDGTSYETSEDTQFISKMTKFTRGTCVKLEYHDNTEEVLELTAVSKNNCLDPKETFTLWDAKIDKMPNDLIGTWIINGETFKTTKKTRFYNEPFEPFSCVDVQYRPEDNLITKIKKESPSKCYWLR